GDAWSELGSAERDPSRGGAGTLPGSPNPNVAPGPAETSRAASRSAATVPSTSAAVVSRESEKRSTPVRSSTPIAFKVGLGPAVLDAQAEPAEASTPRASSACRRGSAGNPGNASEAM